MRMYIRCQFAILSPFILVRLKFVKLCLLYIAHFRWVIKFMEKTLVCFTR